MLNNFNYLLSSLFTIVLRKSLFYYSGYNYISLSLIEINMNYIKLILFALIQF